MNERIRQGPALQQHDRDHDAVKDMFRDVIQMAMEVGLDEALGKERCQRAEVFGTAPNYRNEHSKEDY